MKVVVVGSGIVGASAAYHLTKHNVEVIMVDKEQDGKATSAGAGIVSPWVSSRGEEEDWYRIAKEGAKYYSSLISDLKEDGETSVGYKKVGVLYVSSAPAELDVLEERAWSRKEDAPELGDIERLDSEAARELFPPLNEELEAVFVSGGARVDGRLLREALQRAAQKHGAIMMSGEAGLLHDNGKVTGITINEEAVHADSVLVAAGAWAPLLLKPLGLSLKVEPQRGQIAHIRMPGKDTSDWPVVLPQSSHYMLAFDDSRVVAGATRETGSGFDYRLTAGGVHEVMSEALKVAPGLSSGTLEEVRIGFRPMGQDVLPLLGEIDGYEGLVLATGLGASGLTTGPYVGKLAASLIRKEEQPIDLAAYNPMRSISKIK